MKLTIILLSAGLCAAAADDNRAADREAIRVHIDRIFQAFIHKDAVELRATHDRDWRGFLEGGDRIIRGIDEYMRSTGMESRPPGSPYGMVGYHMREFDVAFHGDSAFATFVADVEANTPAGRQTRTLRIGDFYAKKGGGWIQAGSDTQLSMSSIEQQIAAPSTLGEANRKKLLETREAVWRAFFSNDRATLERLVPEDTITLDPGMPFGTRASVLESAAAVAGSGAKLVRIAFPETRIQSYGATAIIYTSYEYELEAGGQRSMHRGHATEIFVFRNGQWVNPGWHLDRE